MADTPTPTAQDAERIAQAFHATYERLAPSFGYLTRPDSRTAWDEVPETNRRLMVATAVIGIVGGLAAVGLVALVKGDAR